MGYDVFLKKKKAKEFRNDIGRLVLSFEKYLDN